MVGHFPVYFRSTDEHVFTVDKEKQEEVMKKVRLEGGVLESEVTSHALRIVQISMVRNGSGCNEHTTVTVVTDSFRSSGTRLVGQFPLGLGVGVCFLTLRGQQ